MANYSIELPEFSLFPFRVEQKKAEEAPNYVYKHEYRTFYHVTTSGGQHVLWMARGYLAGVGKEKYEVVAWYSNGKFWSGFGTTFKEAIAGALKDAWRYMEVKE